ncbi:hypothetical protein TNCV_2666571 [Trichonephila clavipes]|nr:hypothetical protein TNCV_2666571 [Trichonephila clavipes]
MMLGMKKEVFSILLSGMMAIGRTMESGRRGYGASSGWKVFEFLGLAAVKQNDKESICNSRNNSNKRKRVGKGGRKKRENRDIDTVKKEVNNLLQDFENSFSVGKIKTATAGSDVVQSGRPIFDDFFQHLWPYIGNNTANVVFQMVKYLWLIRMDQ